MTLDRFETLSAVACPLGLANVDTDQLIPARFMKRPRSAGYGGFLLHDLRFEPDGAPRPGFPLDDPRYQDARTLVARRNFGTGSSREAAVYALFDHGVRAVVAPSFGDIFASNAVRNGLLPATVSEADAEALLTWLQSTPEPRLTVDLEACIISGDAITVAFAIDPARRVQLLNGWDDIDLTDLRREEIRRYRSARLASAPWAFPPDRRSPG
jgi:3-isopropylmalate/(R)-2-methylmalate dehydratase small subunit